MEWKMRGARLTQNFCASEECNLAGLAQANFCGSGLHRQPPTPTGAASGHAGWIRLTAPPTANKGAMPLPLPAANEDLGREYEANKA